MNSVGKIFKRITDSIGVITVFLLVILVLLTSGDVLNRLVLGKSMAWAQMLAVFTNNYIVFLFGPAMIFTGGHVTVEVIFGKLKGIPRKIAGLINNLALLTFASIAGYSGILFFLHTVKYKTIRMVGTQLWPYSYVNIILPIGFSLIIMFGIYKLIRDLREPDPGSQKGQSE